MKKKIFITICLIGIFVLMAAPVYATSDLMNNIFDQGNNFTGTSSGMGSNISAFIKTEVLPIVLAIGNLVFAAVTVILGAKYIWSSAEGKAEVMESLPSFVVAVIFFYLGGNLVTWLTATGNSIAGSSSWDVLANNVIWVINTIVHYVAFGGILLLGLRYMFASAEGKSHIKANMGGLVIGIVFVFAASSAVDFIIRIASEAL